ncbi:lysophospholipid acyltransferase family protein [Gallaecimonas mangrovi]|uniref:lysophospholipid acyltransferase family protein n=1 Tax=Gallaecimonas mangrovi TaxID=2291597 RepID=UPI000E205699|nr:lysophospholipid acyltransferase family protein [Gallaecimonas mangrovi]
MGKLANGLMRRLGWRVEGQLPAQDKYLIVVAPHTSNWDFVWGVLARSALGVRIRFLAKHQLFRFPLGYLFRAMGGFAVRRDKANNLVEQVAAYYRSLPSFVLCVTPEGTRSPVTRWKLGFYYIAKAAKVPYVLVGIDYPRRRFLVADPIYPSDDIKADLAQVQQFYEQVQGRFAQPIPPLLGWKDQ